MTEREQLAALRLQLVQLQRAEEHHRKIGEAGSSREQLARLIATARRATQGDAVDRLQRDLARVPGLEAICRRCPSRKPCGALSEGMAALETKLLTAPRTSP